MIKSKTSFLFMVFGFVFGIVFINQMGCVHDDLDLSAYVPTDKPAVVVNPLELTAIKASIPPVIDGTMDSVWHTAPILTQKAMVPEPGDGVFKGYVGKSLEFKLRALYDQEYLYLLAEWDDYTLDMNRESWYYDPIAERWKQEKRTPSYSDDGRKVRDAFSEDKFAILWNVAKSVSGWESTTCFATCHTGLGNSNGYARHYTASAEERVDAWQWKSARNGMAFGQWDDWHQTEIRPNGRKADDSPAGGGDKENKQSLRINGTFDYTWAPKYIIPNRTNYYWITQEEINNGTAKLITGVDPNGTLYYNGGAINPNNDLGFQREGATVGRKALPAIILQPFTGSRADLECKAKHIGTGWILETRRKLKTEDAALQDVDFSALEDQFFGVGIFDNAEIAHAIRTGLILKFKK